MDIVGGEHVVGHIALIQIDVCPLSALSFMTGDGIGKFHLKGIIVTIRLHLLDAFCLLGYICIILHDSIVELLLLFMRQCRSL